MTRLSRALTTVLLFMVILVACSGGGTNSTQAPTIATTDPTSLTAKAISEVRVDLSWSALSDNVAIDGFRIYRDGTYLKSSMTTSISDTGLAASTQYCYQVSAFDAAGNESAKSAQACAITPTPSSLLAQQCAVPRPSSTISPETNQPYGDTQGSLDTEMAWIRSYVNETYLWYLDVPAADPSPYVIGATVPYVDPSDNVQTMMSLATNYDVVEAYFNSQRSPLWTSSGKPKDQFHFVYVTSDWEALSNSGLAAGFGFQAAAIIPAPPREVVVAYTNPSTPAAQNNLNRGAQFLSVNGVDVINGSDVATLNEGLFSPVPGKQYTFQVLDQGSTTPRAITMTAGNITMIPVLNVSTLPSPNGSVGYILFNDHISTAESELIAAINALKAANNGLGVGDLVLDLRYNGGGLLDIASELAFMIAGSAATNGKIFEQDYYNDQNPFGLTVAQASLPFENVTQGFSTTAGQTLPELDLSRVFVITSSSTCSASEAIINGLLGVGIDVIQIGGTTCGKPYGFFPQDNCSTTYFTIQFQGVNNNGFGDYADGFSPLGIDGVENHLQGCFVSDDFTKQLGDPREERLAAVLQYRANGTCPAVSESYKIASLINNASPDPLLMRSPLRENRFFRTKSH
jgi:carboxyl-terminal processing protease